GQGGYSHRRAPRSHGSEVRENGRQVRPARPGHPGALAQGLRDRSELILSEGADRTSLPRPVFRSIALIVAGHFYPMARIFDRTIDYWFATFLTAASIAGRTVGRTTAARPTGDAPDRG